MWNRPSFHTPAPLGSVGPSACMCRFNADGKAYAPWMMNQIDVEATVRAIRRRRERERAEAEGADVDTGEVWDPVVSDGSRSGVKEGREGSVCCLLWVD